MSGGRTAPPPGPPPPGDTRRRPPPCRSSWASRASGPGPVRRPPSRPRRAVAHAPSRLPPGGPQILGDELDQAVHHPTVRLLRVLRPEEQLAVHEREVTDLVGRPRTRAPQGGARAGRE